MKDSLYKVVSDAIADLAAHGFDNQTRVQEWIRRIKLAILHTLTPDAVLKKSTQLAIEKVYSRLVDKNTLGKYHPGVSKFTIERIKPLLRKELDKRVIASANLIRLNREQAIETTLRRFQGWATSVPEGGSKTIDRRAESEHIRKPVISSSFEVRRVAIDQGHKLAASINSVVAEHEGAIACEWHSHWRQPGYHYREDHKERDGKIYLLRGTEAQSKGLVKVGPDGYYDQITAVAEEPFCRCGLTYIYTLRDMPKDMLTAKGLAVIANKS